MPDVWRLDVLPSDVLILIFNLCDAFDLVRLSEVCTRFYEIVKSDVLWVKRRKRALVTNQTAVRFQRRCNLFLSLRNKWHVSHNWRSGRYSKLMCLKQKAKLMPWIQMTADILWWGAGRHIIGFNRNKLDRPIVPIFSVGDIYCDVCKFVVGNGMVISGQRDGSIRGWYEFTNESRFISQNAHASDVNAIDLTDELIISGSWDWIVKLWPLSMGNDTEPLVAINLLDRIWSLAADPTGSIFGVGTTGNNNIAPLHIFDAECGKEIDVFTQRWRKGAGILDLVWDDPHTLLTCGYDTCIRKWDIRTGTCVGTWTDPTDATVYCLSSDYQYTMISGTQYNGKAVLWDQRQRNYVQMYFLGNPRCSSPVYSLSFDSCYLYGGMDQYLFELTFSGRSYEENNYRNILGY